MEQDRSRRIEHLKTAVLVVLFLTTILLLYLLWSFDSQGRLHLPDILIHRETQLVPKAESVIVPDRVVYSMGDGSYRQKTEGTYDVFERGLSQMQAVLLHSDAVVEEITKEQFSESIKDYRSLTIYFPYALPFRELANDKQVGAAPVVEFDREMDVLAFSEASGKSVFFGNTEMESFYRLHAGDDIDYYERMTEDKALRERTVFYRVGDILGGDNDILIPLSAESELGSLRWRRDIEHPGESVPALTESLFGENLDFVRRITDNFGNVTYMYGYGQKTFTHQVDGVLEYKNEATETVAPGFLRELNIALTFAARHNLWSDVSDQGIQYVLSDVEPLAQGRMSGRRFTFGGFIDGWPLRYDSGHPLVIEVLNGQVTYCRTEPIQLVDTPGGSQKRAVHDPANVIARNYNHLHNVLTGNLLSVNEDRTFQLVVSKLTDVRRGYVRLSNDEALRPAWIIEAEGEQSC